MIRDPSISSKATDIRQKCLRHLSVDGSIAVPPDLSKHLPRTLASSRSYYDIFSHPLITTPRLLDISASQIDDSITALASPMQVTPPATPHSGNDGAASPHSVSSQAVRSPKGNATPESPPIDSKKKRHLQAQEQRPRKGSIGTVMTSSLPHSGQAARCRAIF